MRREAGGAASIEAGGLAQAGGGDNGGVLRTIAGTGTAGYAGDGGAATAAQLREPFDACFGPRGDMYVAEAANHCIRCVDRDGKIRTVAGCGRKGYSGD